jgi:hypothetical protein
MKTIEVNKLQTSQVTLNLGALRASSKRPGAMEALAPEVTYVRPKVLVESKAVASYAKVCGFQTAHGVPLLYPHMLAFPLVHDVVWLQALSLARHGHRASGQPCEATPTHPCG